MISWLVTFGKKRVGESHGVGFRVLRLLPPEVGLAEVEAEQGLPLLGQDLGILPGCGQIGLTGLVVTAIAIVLECLTTGLAAEQFSVRDGIGVAGLVKHEVEVHGVLPQKLRFTIVKQGQILCRDTKSGGNRGEIGGKLDGFEKYFRFFENIFDQFLTDSGRVAGAGFRSVSGSGRGSETVTKYFKN